MSTYLAVDLGGGSGRVMAGRLREGKVELDEVHRFANRQVRIGKHLYWDFPMLLHEVKRGLAEAARRYDDIRSIGIDSWGVDYALVDAAGNLIGNHRCYRDESTAPMPAELFSIVNPEAHYAVNGIQVLPINTLFQLMVRRRENPAMLQAAEHLLFTPDLLAYYLCGVPGNEYCIASTSELLDARSRQWDYGLISALELPDRLFGPLMMPGTVRGTILPEVAVETGLPSDTVIVNVGSHDTASAVHAVPFEAGKESVSAYLSSGTWSLLGVLTDEPILSEEARVAGFTNEGGIGGKIRFLQNITGLWILQCLKAEWEADGLPSDFGLLVKLAEESDFSAMIDVDSAEFGTADGMEAKISRHLAVRGLPVPAGRGDCVRCVLLSLADRYRRGIEELDKLLPRPVERLHIIGGGCRNELLNRMTARATGLPVIAGPVEATAIGNIMVQAATLE